MMVRNFHKVIGAEAREQILEKAGRLPDAVAACVGGGSNAIGIFHGFIDDPDVRLVGFEPGGKGIDVGRARRDADRGHAGHAARRACPTCCRTRTARPSRRTRSPPGWTTPGVGPEHSWLKDTGRAEYRSVTDAEAMDAFQLLSRTEGIIPAIESAHALAGALRLGPRARARTALILVNLSGRGDKDMDTAATYFGFVGDTDGTAGPGVRPHARRGPGGAGRLPAGRLPDGRRLGVDCCPAMVDVRLRPASRSACRTPTR